MTGDSEMSNEDILKQIQTLTKTMNDLMTKVTAAPGSSPTGVPLQPLPRHTVSVKPLPVPAKAEPVPVAKEKDTPLSMQEKLAALFEHSKNQDEFCKYAKTQLDISRDLARRYYRQHTAAKRASVAAATVAKLNKVPEGVPATTIPPPIPVPVTKVPETKVPTTVIAAPPPEATPMLANALLQGLGDEAKRILQTQGQIAAIKYIRVKTNMDLLPAKLWVDSMVDIKIPLAPTVIGALQSYCQHMGVSGATHPNLNTQVQAMRTEQVAKTLDPVKAQAEKQRKMDIAGDNKSMLVQAARKVARELGAKGPITIDDVTFEMSKTYNVLPVKGKSQNWKGSVFASGEWVFIGEMASRQVSAHGRPVGMWALKSWLQDNTLNGKETHISSFVVSRLYSDFKRINPKAELKDCNCYLGDERVAAEIRENIKKSGNRLYEIPVSWIPGAVGALILPPEPKKMIV